MHRTYILLATGVAWIAAMASAGCTSDLRTELREAQMAASQERAVRSMVYGDLSEDNLLTPADPQDSPLWSAADHIPPRKGARFLKDAESRTLVHLTDLRELGGSASDDDVFKRLERQRQRNEEVAALKDGASSRFTEESRLNRALSVSISHTSPAAGGPRRVTRCVDLPGRTEVREMEMEMVGLFFKKPQVKWRPVVMDPCAGLYPAFVGGVFTIPRTSDFEASAAKCSFRMPIAEVWTAMMHVVSQYHGILAMASDDGRKVVICRRVTQVPNLKEKGKVLFEAMLLAVAVVRNADDLSTVYCAPLTPDGTLESLSARSTLLNWQEGQQAEPVTSGNYLATANLASRRLFSYLVSPETAKAKSSVPQRAVCVHRVFQELGLQLFGPPLWVAKYLAGPRTGTEEKGAAASVAPSLAGAKEVPQEYGVAAANLGDAVAQTLLVKEVQVIDPNIQKLVADIARRLTQAAPSVLPQAAKTLERSPVRAHVIASPDVQAFALPGGDVFICSGLLDVLDNADQLAAVLAHEISHVVCEDGGGQMHEQAKARRSAEIMSEIMTYALAAAGPFMVGGQIAASAAQGAISGFSSSAVQLWGQAAIEGYSQEAELRADEFAEAALTRSGYRRDSMLALLNWLQSVQTETVKDAGTKQRVQSSLINAKPGLPKRIKKVQSRLAPKG